MTIHVYRYKSAGPPSPALTSTVPGSPTIVSYGPVSYVDVQVDDTFKSDLDVSMAALGYSYEGIDPATTPSQAAASAEENKRLLQKFMTGKPGEGWASGLYREYTGSPWRTAQTWWTNSSKTTKIYEALYTRNSRHQATTIVHNLYASDGTTLVSTITETVTYTGPEENTRTYA